MRNKAILLCAFLFASAISAAAGTYKELQTFDVNNTVSSPYAGVVFDHASNLYGVAAYGGGDYTAGAIFELTPSGNGWTYIDRFKFDFYADNYGEEPTGGVAIDEGNNVYATTRRGNFDIRGNSDSQWDCGTVFSLSAQWVIHNFTGLDGCHPEANLHYYNGRLWGTTRSGGAKGQGTVFSMDTSGNSFQFDSFCGNGRDPSGGLNIWGYGVTSSGGAAGNGNIYKYNVDPKRLLTNKHNFSLDGKAGYAPMGDVLAVYVGGVRKMYGTTSAGGTGGGGAVYQLTEIAPNSDRWQLSVLHSFSSNSEKGWSPKAGLSVDAKGNLYGTTERGGVIDPSGWNCGTVFKLSPGKSGKWTHRVLYSFDAQYPRFEGCNPVSAVVLDRARNLYGTAVYGGESNGGTVYEITP